MISDENNGFPSEAFANAFTLPTQYLPKKGEYKWKKKGKKKVPAVGTSDEWLALQKEKEEKQKLKEEKAQQKKNLQDEKKQLAEERKKIQEKMKELTAKIKKEK